MLTEEEEVTEEARVITYLRDIASYARRHQLRRVLDDPEHRTAYELSDGERSAGEIKKDGNLEASKRTIQRWQSGWVDQGLAERVGNRKVLARYDTFALEVEDGG